MKAELKWSKAALVAEIERLRDREDALTESIVARETELHAAVAERKNLRLVVDEQLKEITSLQAHLDTVIATSARQAKLIDGLRIDRPLSWRQVLDLAESMGGK